MRFQSRAGWSKLWLSMFTHRNWGPFTGRDKKATMIPITESHEVLLYSNVYFIVTGDFISSLYFFKF